jgi:hypothetical protein
MSIIRQIGRLSSCILLGLFVAACQAAPSPEATALSPNLVQPTLTARPTRTPFPPPTRRPTFTPDYLSPTPENIQGTVAPEPTPFLLKPVFAKACSEAFIDYYMEISPDGNWLAEYCLLKNIFQVSNKSGTKLYTLDFQTLYMDPDNRDGTIRPVHWTADNQYIYFTLTPEGWMDGGTFSISDLAPLLYRMQASNGEISKILSGLFYHSFSPTDRRMIEIQEYKHPLKLLIHDLKSGTSQTLIPAANAHYGHAGNVLWSPDGLKFVFVAAYGYDYGDEVSESNVQSLIFVDLASLSQQVVVTDLPAYIKPISWDENDMISCEISSNSERIPTMYTYSYQQGKIIDISTPEP